MPTETIATGAQASGLVKSGGFFSIFKYIILTLIFGIMIMNAIVISVEGNSIEPGVKYLGEKFLTVTENLQIHSQQVIDQGGLWLPDDTIGHNLLLVIKYAWDILTDLLIIYTWLKILAWIAKKLILFNDSQSTIAWLIAIIFFMLLQVIFVLAFVPNKSMMTPINAFVTFIKSLPYIIKPITKIVEKI